MTRAHGSTNLALISIKSTGQFCRAASHGATTCKTNFQCYVNTHAPQVDQHRLYQDANWRTLCPPGRGMCIALELTHRFGLLMVPCRFSFSQARAEAGVLKSLSPFTCRHCTETIPRAAVRCPWCLKPLPDQWPVRLPRPSAIYGFEMAGRV